MTTVPTPVYYTDSQSREHNRFETEQFYTERLLTHLHTHRERLRALFTQQILTLGGNPDHLSYRHKAWHGADDRLEAAWEIIESDAFNLPRQWQPGQVLTVERRETDHITQTRPYYQVTIKYVLNEQILGKVCDCWDYHGLCRVLPRKEAFCKHLVVYWLLSWAFFRLNKSAALSSSNRSV
jgi:hypothetical protein